MSDYTRSELSTKNPYWIERHRYLELKNFCLQYPIWTRAYRSLCGLSARPYDLALFPKSKGHSDPTARCAEAKIYYKDRIKLVEDTVKEAAPDIYEYLLEGVTENVSYNILRVRRSIPCNRDWYYEAYHRFFYLLNKARD